MNSSSGGGVVHKRNYRVLCDLLGVHNVICYPIYRKGSTNQIRMFFDDIIAAGFGGLTIQDKRNIVESIKDNDIKFVFIDSSMFGGLVGYIKKRVNVRTVVFFHNVEYDFWKRQIQLERSYTHSYRIPLAYYNEKKALGKSDMIVTLTPKDSNRLYALYGRNADQIIPVTMKGDSIKVDESRDYTSPLNILFFGSNFPPNIEAAEIIIKQILPKINAHITIAGNGMDVLACKYNNTEQLKIMGFVNDVSELYNESDVILLPIFSGSGMKVKTAEALGYGKNIIASSNALEGYEIEGIPGIFRCDTVDDFVKTINSYDTSLPRFNTESRNKFMSKYSYESSESAFKEMIVNLQ